MCKMWSSPLRGCGRAGESGTVTYHAGLMFYLVVDLGVHVAAPHAHGNVNPVCH